MEVREKCRGISDQREESEKENRKLRDTPLNLFLWIRLIRKIRGAFNFFSDQNDLRYSCVPPKVPSPYPFLSVYSVPSVVKTLNIKS